MKRNDMKFCLRLILSPYNVYFNVLKKSNVFITFRNKIPLNGHRLLESNFVLTVRPYSVRKSLSATVDNSSVLFPRSLYSSNFMANFSSESQVDWRNIKSWQEEYGQYKESLKKCTIPKDELYVVNDVINQKISLHKGDLTKLQVDAIVNAANNSLLGGGGVDGAIHRAAGKQLLDECRGLKGCATGDAKITKGYNLPSKHVIHTVGPIGEKPETLMQCYQNSLKVAVDNNCRTVAFPCISTGVYGYPSDHAASVALQTVRQWMDKNHEKIDRIIFCLFLERDEDAYKYYMQHFFPVE